MATRQVIIGRTRTVWTMDGTMGRSVTSSFGTKTREGHDATQYYNRKMYENIVLPKKQLNCKEETLHEVNRIYHHDSRNMEHLPHKSVHLMITSPPYNVGKEYDEDLNLNEYKDLLRNVMSETYRVLVEGGRACINIANVGRKPYIPLHLYVIEIAQEIGYFMRGEIIWDKGASAGSSCAWGSWQSASNPTLRDVHEYILIFCKSTFKRHPIRQNTISRDDFMDCTKSIWRMNTASAKQLKHAAPFPKELPRRLIHLYSYEGDIVLDPFMGSGTTAEAALETHRKYIGYEIKKEYVEYARKRVSEKTQADKRPDHYKEPIDDTPEPVYGNMDNSTYSGSHTLSYPKEHIPLRSADTP